MIEIDKHDVVTMKRGDARSLSGSDALVFIAAFVAGLIVSGVAAAALLSG